MASSNLASTMASGRGTRVTTPLLRRPVVASRKRPAAGPAETTSFAYAEYSEETAKFWKKELAGDGRTQWYSKATVYWEKNCPPTVDGVLGGFGQLDAMDIRDSREFLEAACTAGAPSEHLTRRGRALDAGAGIGRITKHFLSDVFEVVDLVEPNPRLLGSAPEFLGEKRRHLGESYCSALQSFSPEAGRYDCIWVQWVIIYLTDADLAAFLRRCARALRPGGLIFVKDNTLGDASSRSCGKDLLKDEDDSSVTRSSPLMLHIFREAGLKVLVQQEQKDFPEGMFTVMMYALHPDED